MPKHSNHKPMHKMPGGRMMPGKHHPGTIGEGHMEKRPVKLYPVPKKKGR